MFEERYKKLNNEQKRAVDTIEGPVMVVAGPGTGKTEILTLRIANILKKTDTSPENILAITFTDSASANMRKRLSALIGSSAYRVVIETFHGFCNSIINEYPEYFEEIIGSGNISDVEALSILEEIIEKLSISVLRPWGEPLHYIHEIRKRIDELKREGLSPDEFEALVLKEEKTFINRNDLYHEKGAYKGEMKSEHKDFEKTIVKNKELALIYKTYQETLRKRRFYDWSDMIMEVLVSIRKNKDLKLLLQESYQYILVDEHQDTNNAQNKILEIICDFHKNPNIFIVGDEKQAIFRFQGASLENFLYFKKLYPDAEVIELSKNYRSGQNILDAVHSLLPSKTALHSHLNSEVVGKIFIGEFLNKSHEIYFVAKNIKELIEKKVSPEEIAVIYRSNKEAFFIAETMERFGIPFIIESDEDLFSEKFVRKLVFIFEAIHHYGEDQYLIPLLHMDEFGIDPLSAYKIISSSSSAKRSVYDHLEKENGKIYELGLKMKDWKKKSQSEHLSSFLEIILRESGILHSMISSRSADSFLGVEKLFGEAKRISENKPGADFSDFMNYLRVVKEHKLFIKRPKHNIGHKVRLMTAHRAKGLEFEFVFITNASEKSFGPKSNRDHLKLIPSVYGFDLEKNKFKEDLSKVLDDERRLFYVAMTRAKKTVTITYPSFNDDGKEILPSPFIIEIRDDKKEKIDTSETKKELENNPDILFSERKPNKSAEIDREFVTELFKVHPLSVSALNNYILCPWKYFYRNLLRIPSVPEKHQIYGTAMHSAVEDLWRLFPEREMTEKFLLDSFKKNLGKMGILNDREFKESSERGTKALSGWFKWTKPEVKSPVIPEFSINGVMISDGVLLSGKLDRVEMISEKSAIVTDYKTGRYKSRNEIEGKVQKSNGDIKRQLQFYKLILELHSKIKMEKGIIEFLEPDDKGKYHREEFEISDGEVSELKSLIIKIAEEITSLSFWDKTCDDKTCEYCGYRKLL